MVPTAVTVPLAVLMIVFVSFVVVTVCFALLGQLTTEQ